MSFKKNKKDWKKEGEEEETFFILIPKLIILGKFQAVCNADKDIQITSEINRNNHSPREHKSLSLCFFPPLSKHFSPRLMDGVKTRVS